MRKLYNLVEPLWLVLVPITLILCMVLSVSQTAIISLTVVLLSLLPFIIRIEREKLAARDIMPVVVLSAIASIGRMIFAVVPNFMPVSAIVIIAGLCLGRQNGFLVGMLTALGSNFLLGQGPWAPWQMYCWGMMGYLAGVFKDSKFMSGKLGVLIYGAVASFLFGAIMDTWHIASFLQPINLSSISLAYAAGIPMNLSHAVSTIIFLTAILTPWRKKLTRIQSKFGISQR